MSQDNKRSLTIIFEGMNEEEKQKMINEFPELEASLKEDNPELDVTLESFKAPRLEGERNIVMAIVLKNMTEYEEREMIEGFPELEAAFKQDVPDVIIKLQKGRPLSWPSMPEEERGGR